MPQISPHAIVTCPDNLADDVVVGPFSYVGPKVCVGPGSRIDGNVSVAGEVRIGRDTQIHPFAVIGAEPVDGEPAGRIVIGDHNSIREHAVICGGDAGGEGTRVGSHNLIMIGCYVGADVVIADHIVLGNYSQLERGTRVEEHVWAAAFTGTRPDVTIGRYTFTSGYAGLDRDAPPYAMLQGVPFRVRGVNTHNLKRCGFTDSSIAELKDAFRFLFNGAEQGFRPEALAELAERADIDEHLRYLVDYLIGRNCRTPAPDADPSSRKPCPKGGRSDG